MVKTYTSARERLMGLPEIFTGRDLTAKFQWSSGTASSYLAAWCSSKLARPLGGHSDIYMNLVLEPRPNPEAALRKLWPDAVRIGADILREAGWTTQIMQRPDVAVPPGSPRFQLLDFELQTRSGRWFQKATAGMQNVEGGLRRLRPAWALADLLDRACDRRVRGAWLLAPDDIELDAAREDPLMRKALDAFELAPELLFGPGYEALYDELARRS